jgi:hypothetical protein
MNQQTKHRAGVATGWQRIEDEDGKAQYLPVPAEQRRRPALVGDVLPPMDTGARPPVMTVQTVTTSHTDRAKGFTITSIPLALAAHSLWGLRGSLGRRLLLAYVGKSRRRYDPIDPLELPLCQTRATRPPGPVGGMGG